MKKVTLILALVFIVYGSYSQIASSKKNINFIITIDDKIPFQGNLNLRFETEEVNKKDTFLIEYTPGNISLDESVLNRIQSENVKFISLAMRYTKLCNSEVKSYNYRMEFKKAWLQNSFTVIRFYNLDDKENRKTFYPLEGKEYTYEVDTPNGSQTRVRKRKSKVFCN
jgi:hypothetical protein